MKFVYFNQKYYSNHPERVNDYIYTVPEPWLIFKTWFFRGLCHVWLSSRLDNYFSLPLKKIWINAILSKTFNRNDEVCIIINAHFFPLFYGGIIECARKYFKDSKFVFVFSDKVKMFQFLYKHFPDIELLKQEFDLVVTYNTDDVDKYGLVLDRPCFPQYNYSLEKKDDYSSDVFFVGKCKDRLDKIYKIYDKCNQYGLKCSFFISEVPLDKQRLNTGIIFNKPISYEEVIIRSYNTNCILNIIQEGGSGVTLRDYETFILGKLALTDNKALEITGLYNPQQIIWLDEIDNRWRDIKRGFQGRNHFSKEFSQIEWFKWIKKQLQVRE